jgi:hypothetical protein
MRLNRSAARRVDAGGRALVRTAQRPAAAVELVEALMREGQIRGTEAEAIIDRP